MPGTNNGKEGDNDTSNGGLLIDSLGEFFKGKKVVVTGARDGIGRELVKVLHSKDATVYVVSRFKKHLTSLKIECPNIIPIEANLRNWKDTEEALAEKIDGIDMLVNNAEELHRQNFFEIRPETFDRLIDVNVKSVICVTKVLTAKMIAAGNGGAIVNVSSMASQKAAIGTGLFAFCASKAAQDMITRCLAVGLGEYNIRVNSVNPTIVENDFRKDFWSDDEEHAAQTEVLKQLTPLKSFASVNDVVNAIIFLLSDKASMITGLNLMIDGGFSAR